MPKPADTHAKFHQSLLSLLEIPYPDEAAILADMIEHQIALYLSEHPNQSSPQLSESDIVLITYGDSLIDEQSTPPLQVLNGFLQDQLYDVISTVHILPYFPFSSDDGFAVIDYFSVNPALGNWQDIETIADGYRLMTDLVINHVSRESLWFIDYLGGNLPGCDYFIEQSPETDLSKVTRPRNSPLLVPIKTRRGEHHVWATFSEDQIDLNFRNSDVLIQMIDVVLTYMAKGTSVIRLDAIAYLWKEPDTSCIHRPETHAIVKLFRLIMEKVHPGATLLTETNVPNHENLSYFGAGDEAHMVYQFALPPLILHALNRGTEKYLVQWARSLPDYPDGCTVLNFTASHDGIGLRPLEGLVPENEVTELVDSMHRFGGFVSVRTLSDLSEKPYEINVSLFDALKGTRRGEDQWQVQRFLCSQIIMLGLRGVPALYIHSLLATPNDLTGVESTGRTRSINRRKWPIEELLQELENPVSMQHMVFDTLKSVIKIRKQQHCFHPSAAQEIVGFGSGLFAFRRSANSSDQILAIHNLTSGYQKLETSHYSGWLDLLSEKTCDDLLLLQPYQSVWLVNKPRQNR